MLLQICVAVRSLCWVCFFFKQKTAYEMRISDWSSDVCSSDLLLHWHRRGTHRPSVVSPGMVVEIAAALPADVRGWCHTHMSIPNMKVQPNATPKIGRASCRERVCQYV